MNEEFGEKGYVINHVIIKAVYLVMTTIYLSVYQYTNSGI